MKRFRAGLAYLTLAAAAAVAGLPTKAAAANYEAVYIPGTAQTPFGFFRIAVATGQVSFGYGAATSFTTIAETDPLPAGDYHLYLSDQAPDSAGVIIWAIVRMDRQSGRAWTLLGGGAAPFRWAEMVAPK